MSGNIRLSFCIPTYNFGEFIGQTLESIIAQATDEVDIVIGDGASTDNTAEVVQRYQAQFPRLSYFNFGQKGGVDLDIAKTVDLACGRYCWLMSADDVLRPGAIARMLAELEFGHAIYLYNRTDCSRDMREMVRRTWLPDGQGDRVFDFSDHEELCAYLESVKGLGALFSYISSIVVDREKWLSVEGNAPFMGTNYAHVHRLFSIAKAGGKVKYIEQSLVKARLFNDSFAANGMAKRFLIDLDGYRLLGEHLFAEKSSLDALKAVMRKEHKWYFLASLRNRVGEKEWQELERRLAYYGYRPSQLYIADKLGTSGMALPLARRIRRVLAK